MVTDGTGGTIGSQPAAAKPVAIRLVPAGKVLPGRTGGTVILGIVTVLRQLNRSAVWLRRHAGRGCLQLRSGEADCGHRDDYFQ
jgi:hypothetical protein